MHDAGQGQCQNFIPLAYINAPISLVPLTRFSIPLLPNPPSSNPSCTPHLVKRDELEKAIRFLKGLLEATDKVKMVK
ncbi:hypothetical protein DO021_02615 [Desulfobacter hydrogenophilus]|uniref:Uncharacterized protein n=1 Tax=Desulfobacter hydrogenophilus TaxID=2291 RepID=A0A328FFJ7_9BACT|nr:hypothetical protein EYB58_04490 [Desulfobacter hydrogenophilus]RAM03431.1 hypothetical protein DO021_02615 [Desulfobacter hydrogenophilus]